ncbi:hypothetical protein K1T71_006827 [Dendrolimus kikuchii]|uniref:Uncharacterized protein n=1 Tax=Dendrolimus kikuchii TaxID=765133 RepID=A0ACC1D2J9_9NEOP|nr:hypothetical protein K1T71_006827 [Dendrolimus kikuchii]
MSNIRPIPASRHSQPSYFVFKELSLATHVFLREDAIKHPLQSPYRGPYLVLNRTNDGKVITLDIKGRPVTVSIDRVKPAFTDHPSFNIPPYNLPPPVAQPSLLPTPVCTSPGPVVTRTGRTEPSTTTTSYRRPLRFQSPYS